MFMDNASYSCFNSTVRPVSHSEDRLLEANLVGGCIAFIPFELLNIRLYCQCPDYHLICSDAVFQDTSICKCWKLVALSVGYTDVNELTRGLEFLTFNRETR